MLNRRLFSAFAALALLFAGSATAVAQDKSIVVASTTSTQDSGLFDYLLPLFKTKTGIDVKVIAQGTGQALDTARRGDDRRQATAVFPPAAASLVDERRRLLRQAHRLWGVRSWRRRIR